MKIYNWHKINDTTLSGLEAGKLTCIDVDGKKIGMLKHDNILYSFAALCPHAGAALCEGWLDARGHIVCPDHKYRFDPATGRNTSGEGYKLVTYPIEIRDDGIYIGIIIPETG